MDYRFFKDYKKEIKENLRHLKVVYTDLDGTLFNDRGCFIRDYRNQYYFDVINLLTVLEDKKIDVVPVSGRSAFQLRCNSQMMGLKNYIAELGAELIYNQGKEVYTTFDTNKPVYDTGNGGKDLIKITELLKKNFPGRIDSKLEWSSNRNYNAIFFGEIDIDRANSLVRNSGYENLVLVNNGFSSLVELDLDVEKLNIYVLIPEGVNKSSGIKLDKKIRNFGTENCIALGDSVEDLKMADQVKYCFLMRNALDNKKYMSSNELNKYDNVYIADGIMNRGWVEVMEYLLG
jgi:HAD superfamily hydrolase (TIGR01484 family)